uniref:Nucleotide-diphospho-sugar transferase domain-containing protein n=1 Tax=Chrysotila carterae TaxID=13221 RepID=A0A7S4B4S9_CHRCT
MLLSMTAPIAIFSVRDWRPTIPLCWKSSSVCPSKIETTEGTPQLAVAMAKSARLEPSGVVALSLLSDSHSGIFDIFYRSITLVEQTMPRPFFVEKFVFVCADKATLAKCAANTRRNCVLDASLDSKDAGRRSTSRLSRLSLASQRAAAINHSRFTARKAELVLLGLRQGLSVLWTDLDVIWHKDPLPFVLAHPAELQLSGMRCYNASQTTTQLCKNEVNSGIYFARATPLALRFFEDWVDGTPDHRKVGFKFCSQSDCPDLAINDEHHYLGNLPHEDQPRLAKLFGNFKRQSATANFSQVVHDPTFFPGMLEVNMQRSPGCDSYFLHAAGFVGNLTKLKLMCDHLCAYDHKCLSPAERLLPESQKEYCEFARKLLPLKGKPQRPPG